MDFLVDSSWHRGAADQVEGCRANHSAEQMKSKGELFLLSWGEVLVTLSCFKCPTYAPPGIMMINN